MRWLALGYVIVLLYNVVFAQEYGASRNGGYSNERRLIDYLRDVKRTNWIDVLCGKWHDWCLPDTHKPGLTCCRDYTCKCNLWNTNCRCRARLFGK